MMPIAKTFASVVTRNETEGGVSQSKSQGLIGASSVVRRNRKLVAMGRTMNASRGGSAGWDSLADEDSTVRIGGDVQTSRHLKTQNIIDSTEEPA